MILGDRELAGYIVRSHQVCLSRDWEEWMLTAKKIEDFKNPDALSPDVAKVVSLDEGRLTFIGQMTPGERDELLAHTSLEHDKKTIEEMYEEARPRCARLGAGRRRTIRRALVSAEVAGGGMVGRERPPALSGLLDLLRCRHRFLPQLAPLVATLNQVRCRRCAALASCGPR